MTTGWRGESKRHSIAAKYGQAGFKKASISAIQSKPMGAANIIEVLPNFRIVEWRHGAAAGSGFLARQDLIDYYIEESEKQMKETGKEVCRPIFNFPKEWHSKYKTSEQTVVV